MKRWIWPLLIVLSCTIPQDNDTYLRLKWCARLNTATWADSFVLGIQDSVRSGGPDTIHINVGCIPPPGQQWTLWGILMDYAGNASKSNLVTTLFLPSR